MFSKAWASALAAGLMACALSTGCGPKGLPTGGSGMQLGGSDTGCLTRAHASATKFMNGEASEAETSEIWDCAIHSLQLFSNRTRGARAGVYSPDELRAFLEKFFLVDSKISDGLLREAMELKRTVIGGKLDELTLDELSRARGLLTTFRTEALRLRTYMPMTRESMSRRSEADVDNAARALTDAAQEFGAVLENTGIPYSFAHFNALLGELHQFLRGEDSSPMLDRLRTHLPLIEAVKATLIAPEGDRIGGGEWSAVLTAGARWYGIFLRYQTLDRDYPSWIRGSGRARLVELVRDSMQLVDEAIARHPRQQISFEELDALIAAALPEGYPLSLHRYGGEIPATVTLEHIQAFLRPLIRNLMGGSDRGYSGRSASGLTRPALRGAWHMIEHWSEGQNYLEAVFSAAARSAHAADDDQGYTSDELGGFSLDQLFSMGELKSEGHGAGRLPSVLVDASSKLRQILTVDRPLFRGGDSQVYFGDTHPLDRHSFHGLSVANGTYELARMLMHGYAGDRGHPVADDDQSQAVTLPEFKSFVDAIHDIAVDVKFLDPNDDKIAAKRFREAALFTYAGDGDEYMTAQEGAQLLTLMISGESLARDVHQALIDTGCRTYGTDLYGFKLIEAGCYRREFFKKEGLYRTFWKNMPGLIHYYEKELDDVGRSDFEHAMEDAARKRGYSGSPMDSSDTEGFAMISQYIEVVFERFDRNRSGVLDWNDANDAFPVFGPTLKEFSCQLGHCLTKESDLRMVFGYMLSHGKVPGTADALGWMAHLGACRVVRFRPAGCALGSDRGKIMHIFAELGKPAP